MTTILITGPSVSITNNIQSAFESIFLILFRKLSNPFVLPGAGYWQNYIAGKIYNPRNKNISYRRALDIYKNTLLYYSNLSRKNSIQYFNNINISNISEYLSYGIIDCFDSNMKILNIATDAAACLLEIDEEIYIHSPSINV